MTKRHRMAQVWPVVRERMRQAQEQQARYYNRGALLREFQPGDKVMILIPTQDCKFLARWHGTYVITDRVGGVTYRVRQPGRRKEQQLYHINLLKPWREAEAPPTPGFLADAPPPATPEVPMGSQLSERQLQDLRELLDRNRDRFSSVPGRTGMAVHNIRSEPEKTVRIRPYRIPEPRRAAF